MDRIGNLAGSRVVRVRGTRVEVVDADPGLRRIAVIFEAEVIPGRVGGNNHSTQIEQRDPDGLGEARAVGATRLVRCVSGHAIL